MEAKDEGVILLFVN